jgi:hypothetical protein
MFPAGAYTVVTVYMAAAVMPWLAKRSARLSAATGSGVLRADADQSALCAYMSLASHRSCSRQTAPIRVDRGAGAHYSTEQIGVPYDAALRSQASTIAASFSVSAGAAFLIMTINQSISSGAEG